MVITGTVIGAGFASGQEINQYFIKYGKSGVLGIMLSTFLFTLISAVVLCKICKTGASSPTQYLGKNCPRFLVKLYKVLSVSFMLVTFCTMVTASGEMFYEQLHVPGIIGIIVMDIICVISFKKGEEGLVGVNKILTPVIIVITLIVFFDCLTAPAFVFNLFENAVTSSVVYVSYNTISIIAVLTAVSGQVKNKTAAVLGALISGFMLLVSSLCIWYILTLRGAAGSIPMLNALFGFSKILYMPVLFFALVTTAVSCGFGVIKEFENENLIIVCLLLASFGLSRVGLERLVAVFYSVFGYVGLAVGAYTIFDGIKYLK